MKSLNPISVFKISVILAVSLYFNNIYAYIFCFLVLLISESKYSFIYLLLVFLCLSFSQIDKPVIKYGIVEKRINNYYVVDSLFNKTKIIEDVEIGDIIEILDYNLINDSNYLKKNIKFIVNDYKVKCNFKIRKVITNRIASYNESNTIGINKFIYNINNYDDLGFNLGYGLAIYYLIKKISSKNKFISCLMLMFYTLLFYFDIKFYLLIIEILLDNRKINKYIKFSIKLITVCLLNRYLLLNYSLLIPLLFSLYSLISTKLDFKTYLILLESFFFGQINLISTFLFKYMIIAQIFMLLFSLLVLVLPEISFIYDYLLKIYSHINMPILEIRGSLSITGLVLFIIFMYCLKPKNSYFIIVLLLCIILSPFNNPFMHISFIDVGQGDSILIKGPINKYNILIDTGSNYNYYKLKNYLYKEGIYKLDYLIITHNDSDHNGNINNLISDFKVKNVIVEGTDIILDKLSLKYLKIGNFDNDNDNSLVYYANINDLSFLFTGDISKTAERKFIKKYSNIDIDILKVSHHGSSTSTSKEFVTKTLPKIAIISTSGQYGHPSTETIKTLNMYKCDQYITKEKGNIEIYMTSIINWLKSDIGDFVIIK